MAIHHTTFVLPGTAIGLPHDSPFLVLGADTVEETDAIPLVTSLHRIGNEVMPFSHASTVLGPIPVTDGWAAAVQEDYDGAAKIVVLREPVPHDISTEFAAVADGVLGPDLPPWLGQLLAGQLHAATRDVPVTFGEDGLSIGIAPSAPTSLPRWAHQFITPPGA